ncbi:hypothetical protein A0H81_11055 [Grifola frondosa]|uniref:Ubiquitin-like protease family profile domain-containing protein n=1 Tax=Grifola frondosa TaxID=5627 RepID=A0A1C7LV32_GRIFR|nr:hypothetical protein A0H81_11055 [Grifola frondosa]
MQLIVRAEDMASVWKKAPTAIPVPQNGQTMSNNAGNPFNRKRMGDTLSNGKGGNRPLIPHHSCGSTNPLSTGINNEAARGNRTAAKTVFGGCQGPHRSENRVQESKLTQNNAALAHSAIIISDDEDIGEVIPRERQVISREQENKRPSPDPLDTLRSSSPSAHAPGNYAAEANRTAPDGPSTKILQARLKAQFSDISPSREDVDVDLSDGIESWTAEHEDQDTFRQRHITPGGRTEIPHGTVKLNVFHYETIGKNKPLSSNSSSRVSQMKSRVGSTVPTPSLGKFNNPTANSGLLDPIATASSGFIPKTVVTKKKSSLRKSQGTQSVALPLEAFAFSFLLYDHTDDGEGRNPPFWLLLDDNSSRLIIKKRLDVKRALLEFSLDRDFEYCTWTDVSDSDSTVVVRLQAGKAGYRTGNQAVVPHLKPGHKAPDSSITFKFLTQHANWKNGQSYETLVTMLKKYIKRTDSVRGVGARRCWEAALKEANDKLAEESRKKGPRKENEGSVSLGLSDDNSIEVTEKKQPEPRFTRRVSALASEPRVTRQSTRNSHSSPPLDLDELILVYPPTGTGAINITVGDLKRLDDGQYLNDTIIEFGLKLWLNDLREKQPDLAEQIYVFSSFFYKKLNIKNKEDGYRSVRKWTSKVDIFKKKYIIVPINENLHWYLAIIHNPEHMLQPPPPMESKQTRKRKRQSDTSEVPVPVPVAPAQEEEVVLNSCPPSPQRQLMNLDSEGDEEVEMLLKSTSNCSITDLEQQSGLDNRTEVDGTTKKTTLEDYQELMYPSDPFSDPLSGPLSDPPPSPQIPASIDNSQLDFVEEVKVNDIPMRTYDSMKGKERASSIDGEDDRMDETTDDAVVPEERPITYIYTFDSLGTRHPHVVTTLGKYLQMEAKDKKGLENTSLAKGKRALVPIQPNYCDCGLYVLHFARSFMADPDGSSHTILSRKEKEATPQRRQEDWSVSLEEFQSRQKLRTRIQEMSETWKKERAAKEEQKKEEAAQSGKTAVPVSVDDSDDDIVMEDVVVVDPTADQAKPGSKAATGGQSTAARLRG